MAKKPTREEQLHYERVRTIDCIINNSDCGGIGLELHHPTGAGMGLRASNMDVIPLCFNHHSAQTSLKFGHSVHKGTKSFESRYGTQESLLARVRDLLNERTTQTT